jgi:hypothetical protein
VPRTAAVAIGHLALKRAIRRAWARGYATINASDFADTPKGQRGRPQQIPHTPAGAEESGTRREVSKHQEVRTGVARFHGRAGGPGRGAEDRRLRWASLLLSDSVISGMSPG